MRRVLLIAYQFPPFAGSSGVQRAFRFARHLSDFAWDPIVLTAHPRAYERCNDDLLKELQNDVPVIRAPAWDAKRHFAIAGRYPGFLGRPDRWRSWLPGAVLQGMRAIRRYKPEAVWSTFPIATTHSIGASIAKQSGLPWIADFRDPMAQEGYPPDPLIRRMFEELERRTVSRAAISTLTTPSAVRMYQDRYPDLAERFVALENGFDEETFVRAGDSNEGLNPGRLTLLHSGYVYPNERDPSALIAALGQLRESAPESYSKLVLRFRAAGSDDLLRELAGQHQVESNVEILPAVAYEEAIQEMCRADGLLIAQADNCNAQIPAKFYEYARAGRPILTLADPKGDTGRVAREAGLSAIAPLAAKDKICQLLQNFVQAPEEGTLVEKAAVSGMSRYARTRELAVLLDLVTTAD